MQSCVRATQNAQTSTRARTHVSAGVAQTLLLVLVLLLLLLLQCIASGHTPSRGRSDPAPRRGSVDHLLRLGLHFELTAPVVGDPPVDGLEALHLLPEPDDVVDAEKVLPQGTLAVHVGVDALVIPVLNGRPFLLGAHLVDLTHGSEELDQLLEGCEDEHGLQPVDVQLRPATLHVGLDKRFEIGHEVLLHDLEVLAIEPPPELVAHAHRAQAGPVDDAATEPVLLVAPEVGVIHIHVDVGEGNVVGRGVLPAVDLVGVGVHQIQRRPELIEEGIVSAIAWVDGLASVRDETDSVIYLAPQKSRVLTRVAGEHHAPRLHAPALHAPEALLQQADIAHLAGLVQAGHLGPSPDQEQVVLLRVPTQVVVEALVVGAFDHEGPKGALPGLRPAVVLPGPVGEEDAVRDEDPVRGVVAYVPEVEPRDPARHGRLQKPVAVQLVELLGLLVDGARQSVRPRGALQRVRDLGEQLGG
mmetsp:Transcript_20722/g.65597  ORF Transcript_20722/g.65597 Transcript_20722/m.65597 type:complete len:471 (-) Transcript_20722:439-1851(-)